MLHDKIEDTDGYAGLHGEVVTEDAYRLRTLDFVPDVIFDLGANIGIFARYARELFPRARIVSVEPDATNYKHLCRFTADLNVVPLNLAIGVGSVYEHLHIPNGAHGCFISPGVGYPAAELAVEPTVRKSSLELVMPDLLLRSYDWPGAKVLFKMDIEGNEHTVFSHEPSMAALRKLDYLCFEVHKYALHGGVLQEARDLADKALASFEATHDCSWDHIHFYARKRK